MESNEINVNIQLPNNTYLENYSISTEKLVEEVLQDLQHSFHIPKFEGNNQFILALVFKGYILPSTNSFGEMSIKNNSFLKVKKIAITKIGEKDFYLGKMPPIELFQAPITGELLPHIPEQPSPTMELPTPDAEKTENLQAVNFNELPTEPANIDFAKTFEVKNDPPKVKAPPKKKRSKILTAILTILGTIFLLSLVFVAFLVFQVFYGSKLKPFNDNVSLNTNTNANEINVNAGTNTNVESTPTPSVNVEGNANVNANNDAKAETSVSPTPTETTTPTATKNATATPTVTPMTTFTTPTPNAKDTPKTEPNLDSRNPIPTPTVEKAPKPIGTKTP